jgi:hypothetical protein
LVTATAPESVKTRPAAAAALFNYRAMHTYIKPTYNDPEAFFVDTWYNPSCRQYVTQLKDLNRNQIGEATYSGSKESAERAHHQLVDSFKNDNPHILLELSK